VDIMPPSSYLGEFEYLVLVGIARLGDRAHAPELLRLLEDEAGRPTSRSALYTTLERLEEKGLVRWKVATGDAARDHLPRRVYDVTASGLSSVRQSHRAMTRMARGIEHLLVK
jgi:PadR family transcriptional regulator PadR